MEYHGKRQETSGFQYMSITLPIRIALMVNRCVRYIGIWMQIAAYESETSVISQRLKEHFPEAASASTQLLGLKSENFFCGLTVAIEYITYAAIPIAIFLARHYRIDAFKPIPYDGAYFFMNVIGFSIGCYVIGPGEHSDYLRAILSQYYVMGVILILWLFVKSRMRLIHFILACLFTDPLWRILFQLLRSVYYTRTQVMLHGKAHSRLINEPTYSEYSSKIFEMAKSVGMNDECIYLSNRDEKYEAFSISYPGYNILVIDRSFFYGSYKSEILAVAAHEMGNIKMHRSFRASTVYFAAHSLLIMSVATLNFFISSNVSAMINFIAVLSFYYTGCSILQYTQNAYLRHQVYIADEYAVGMGHGVGLRQFLKNQVSRNSQYHFDYTYIFQLLCDKPSVYNRIERIDSTSIITSND